MLDQINEAEDKRAEREEAIKLRRDQLEENQKVQEEKFKRKIKQENDLQINELDDLKNKVLEMQVESAYDRGKAFQERLGRDGVKEEDTTDMMN
jgi:ABC-type amino acid transport substrate-binding protein